MTQQILLHFQNVYNLYYKEAFSIFTLKLLYIYIDMDIYLYMCVCVCANKHTFIQYCPTE